MTHKTLEFPSNKSENTSKLTRPTKKTVNHSLITLTYSLIKSSNHLLILVCMYV